MERFPEDFIFELAENEVETEVSQNVIPPKKHLGGASPFTLPEKEAQSSILNSLYQVWLSINCAV